MERTAGQLRRPELLVVRGTLRESSVLWLKYRDHRGLLIRESSGTEKEGEAKRLLKLREAAAVEGRPIIPRVEKVTVAELAENLSADYLANGRRTLARDERIHRAPKIVALRERNIRQGFFEREQFEAVRRSLPEYLRAAVTFAYITGWRMTSEILPLEWRQVDFRAGSVRLEPGTTKNDEGRMFHMTPELRAALEGQRAATDVTQRRAGRIIPGVFHRRGKPIKDIRKAWEKACKAAGCPGRIPHDFRRTAVRNLERASVPRSAAMRMVGHKTESVYRRYAIVDEAMLRERADKLSRFEQQGKVEAVTVPHLGKVAENPPRLS